MTLADDARHLNLRALRRWRRGARHRTPLPPLLLLTDERRLNDPSAAVLTLPRGAGVVLRHYGCAKGRRAALARRLRALTRRRGVLLLIAADGALAQAVGADGLHLPEGLLRHGAWRALRPRKPGWLVTAAVHSLPALRLAERAGVDAALLSPVFATASHPGAAPLGVLRFAAWTRASKLPVYALGGIDARSAARLRTSPACGLAGIGGLLTAPA